jgi:hypothetical protein
MELVIESAPSHMSGGNIDQASQKFKLGKNPPLTYLIGRTARYFYWGMVIRARMYDRPGDTAISGFGGRVWMYKAVKLPCKATRLSGETGEAYNYSHEMRHKNPET